MGKTLTRTTTKPRFYEEMIKNLLKTVPEGKEDTDGHADVGHTLCQRSGPQQLGEKDFCKLFLSKTYYN